MRFTEDQTLAYQAMNENVIVSAGAGSGKTQVLSERVRYLVEEHHYHIDEFLILTFTNLAAGEMKERIRKKLLAVAPEEAKRIDHASICTFDSYALAIVKKYHALLNLSKSISVADGNMLKIFVQDKVDELFFTCYEQEDPVLLEMTNRYCFKTNDALKGILFGIYEAATKALDEEEYLKKIQACSDTIHTNIYLKLFEDKIDQIVETFKEEATLLVSNPKVSTKFIEAFYSYDESSDLTSKINALKGIKYPQMRNVEEEESKEKIATYKKELSDWIKTFPGEKEFIKEREDQTRFVKWFIDKAKYILRITREYQHSMQCFSFMEIAKMAIKLFDEHPEITSFIKNSIKTIMIDEYQDTSGIQEKFISYISNNNVYMVGDVKQSIYRFRNATPELFIDKFNRYKKHEGGRLISLNANFRSRKEVLTDINHLFSKIMSEEYGGANYKEDHMILAGNKLYDQVQDSLDHRTEVLLYSNEDKMMNKTELEARLIAQDILKKIEQGYEVFNGDMDHPGLRKARLSDFCVLRDRGTETEIYQRVFKEYQIPTFVENNEDIFVNPIIMVIINLLKIVYLLEKKEYSSPSFVHCYLSLARSFIFEISDEEIYHQIQEKKLLQTQIVEQIQENYLLEKQGVSNFIVRMVRVWNVYGKLVRIGDIRMYEKYLDIFLQSLDGLQKQGFLLEDYIHYFERIKEIGLKIEVPSSTTSFDAVRMMNIFKSKGLEFPIIYCAGLNKEFVMDKYKKLFYISEKYGILFPHDSFEKSFLFSKNKEEELQEDFSEKIRVLYVALTRAKEKVICLLPKDMKEKPLSNINCLGDLITPYLSLFQVSEKELEEQNHIVHQYNQEEKYVTYEDLEIEDKPYEMKKASKSIKRSSMRELLRRGEQLHFYLEEMDFMNPNYLLISNQKDRMRIKNFITSPLIQNLTSPTFYKEYEFIDEIHHTRGSIDCLILDGEKAYIIDYKLKNIDDDAYLDQLKVYYDYVSAYFNKNAECYLYSILDSILTRVEIEKKA